MGPTFSADGSAAGKRVVPGYGACWRGDRGGPVSESGLRNRYARATRLAQADRLARQVVGASAGTPRAWSRVRNRRVEKTFVSPSSLEPMGTPHTLPITLAYRCTT